MKMAMEGDAENKAIAACNAVVVYTDTVLSLRTADMKDFPSGVASCVFAIVDRIPIAVTCAHVVRDAKAIWCGLPRTDKPVMPAAPAPQLTPVSVIDSNDYLDLAILDARSVNLDLCRKNLYPLTLSAQITSDVLARNRGTMSCICGTWGEEVEVYTDSPRSGLVEIPLYAAAGPIHDVQEGLIVGDYAEVNLLAKNVQAFPQLNAVQLTGGSRWLGGTSGSGLWVTRDGQYLLAGILLGPLPSQANQQLIRFAPIWKLCEWLTALKSGPRWPV